MSRYAHSADRVFASGRGGWPITTAAWTGTGRPADGESRTESDVREAARITAGMLAEEAIPFLPAVTTGPGSEGVARAAALCTDLTVEATAAGWRLTRLPGRDARRAASRLGEDADAAAEVFAEYAGPVKISLPGPVSLAALLFEPRGESTLADPGARRDVMAGYAHGLSEHVTHLRRLMPGAEVIIQLDEPHAAAALSGQLATTAGRTRLPALPETEAATVWRDVREAIASAGGQMLAFLPGARPLTWYSHGQARSLTEVLTGAGISGIGINVDARTDARLFEQVFAWWDGHQAAGTGHAVPALTLGVGTASGTEIDITAWRRRLTSVAETLGLPDTALAELGILTGPPAPLTRSDAQAAVETDPGHPRTWLAAASQLAQECAALA
ncbi:hypothetical protein M3B11_08060 [Brevibacterium sp. p3-SID960]|uniref:hypothetical protein n=1 Tax=Brevibacterium sp. p3-SID960 TaxID=2916063 RepID=UPI0021A5CE47|nr:hypothetical protein [Brevibacterium sp. p3-SID960]MCT1690909.1 hypothetical protein [Brevibacterium sp. p3-SID960]